MRYFLFLSLCVLAVYAATGEEIYYIYKTKGIKSVEEFLKKEYESKEVKEPTVPVQSAKELKREQQAREREEQQAAREAAREVAAAPVKENKVKVVKVKNPTEKELMSRDFWLKQLRGMELSYGYYENVDSLIVCEKERKRCEVFRNDDDGLKLVKVHEDVIMGKGGDKLRRGDLKTPVGVYEIIKRFKPTNQFYGPLAFALSYPNLFDVLRGRNGDGIWIHGMPLDGKDRDDLSKGCVVFDNTTILTLDTEINAQSSVVIIGENKVPKMSKELTASILSEVYRWQHAWKINDINAYLNYYSNDFKKSDGSGKLQFSNMKKQIFSRKENKTIIFEHMSVSPYPSIDERKLYKISFDQTYKAPSLSSKGEKELYVEMIGEKMYILAEK